MGYLELDLDISKEGKAIFKEAHNFCRDVMRPVGIELDKLQDPEDVCAKGSPYWDVVKGYREIGLHITSFPKVFGGMAEDIDDKTNNLLNEVTTWGDAGLSISLSASRAPFYLATMTDDTSLHNLARDYVNDLKGDLIGCWAITEPQHGSDAIMGIRDDFNDPSCGFDLIAELKGDEYILNGQKSAWVSNGTIATHALVHLTIDPSKGMMGGGLAIVPLDLPGISRGKPLNKMGQRPLNQGEIFFKDVQLPKNYMIISDPAVARATTKMILTAANGGMGLHFVGLAQAAYDEALAYAKQRIQGGVPIFEHQNVKLQLFNMFTKVESARAFARAVSTYNHKAESRSTPHAMASKILSTNTAFEVATETMAIFSGNGLAKEYPIEKLFRDARASITEDGENTSLALAGSEGLIW